MSTKVSNFGWTYFLVLLWVTLLFLVGPRLRSIDDKLGRIIVILEQMK